MKTGLNQITESNRKLEQATSDAIKAEIENPFTDESRRNFLKKIALGGIGLAGMKDLPVEETLSEATQKVKRSSKASDLRITDMRYCVIEGRRPLIRIYTNQDITGIGEVRDGADWRYAMILKSRLLGKNPCNVEMIFRVIKQFGGQARQGGGVSGVEMALWDLTGKAYGVPCWQLLGGRYRDRVRMYAYVPRHDGPNMDVEKFKADIKHRIEDQGYTMLKTYPSLSWIWSIPGTTVNGKFWNTPEYRNSYSPLRQKQPLTQIQVTEKGCEELAKYVDLVRSIIGWDTPLGADGLGNYDVNNAIRVAKAFEPYRLAFLEDVFMMDMIEQWKAFTDAITTPTLHGEDIYLREKFFKLIDAHAIDIVHPDLASAGGLLETKIIGDYAEEHDMATLLHFAGTPVSFMANVHCAAATNGVLALEMPSGSVDDPEWEKLVTTTDGGKIYEKGFANVPLDSPGLGIELNDEFAKQHLAPENKNYFLPSPEWDNSYSNDALSSVMTTGGVELEGKRPVWRPEPPKQ
jgi:L-alanine-DL-glutamate epimerase-like enolase superfamily enzyme